MDCKVSLPKLRKNCDQVSARLRALAHPKRLLILGTLIEGDKTVTELQELCGISQSQLSQFLARMKLEKLVICKRRGRFQSYAIADERIRNLVLTLQTLYCR